MTDLIQTIFADGIAEIRFNRPDKKNAILVEMYAALRDAIRVAEIDPSIRVILFTAAGDSFTAGNDLKDFLAPRGTEAEPPVTGFLNAIATAEKPMIAAVRGNAVGVGTTMLLHCDLVLASPEAQLQVPFVNLGLVPEAASSLLLPRLLGHQRAAALVLLGDRLGAAEALAAGLVYRVVPLADLDTEARAVAARLAAQAPTAVHLSKRLLKRAPESVADRMAEEGKHFAAQLQSAEVKEAIGAFFEKRPADFSRI